MAPATYVLPDLPWAVLLEPILQQAPPGATIIVNTTAMREHVEHAVRTAGRGDLNGVPAGHSARCGMVVTVSSGDHDYAPRTTNGLCALGVLCG